VSDSSLSSLKLEVVDDSSLSDPCNSTTKIYCLCCYSAHSIAGHPISTDIQLSNFYMSTNQKN
jgi:hypothetical protein